MTQRVAIGSSGECPDDALLTLRELAAATGWNEDRLRSYVDRTPVNDYVHARRKRGSKGVGYPPASIPFFEKLLVDAEAKKVVPTTLSGWLDDLSVDTGSSGELPNHSTSMALTLSGGNIGSLAELPNDRWDILRELAGALNRLPATEDCLIDARQAGELLCCAPGSVRRHVKPVLRGRWRRSDVFRYIGSLGK